MLLNRRHLPLPSLRQGSKLGQGLYVGAVEYECICVSAYHPDLLGAVIHINEHLWLTASTHVEMLLVFSHSTGVV